MNNVNCRRDITNTVESGVKHHSINQSLKMPHQRFQRFDIFEEFCYRLVQRGFEVSTKTVL